MLYRDRFDGSASPFEGDLALTLRGLPAEARVTRAGARLLPLPSEEEIRFGDPRRNWGATIHQATEGSVHRVEVNFHNRRTLSRVRGNDLGESRLLVNLGGIYVAINPIGAIASAGENAFTLSSPTPMFALPGLTVSAFQLIKTPGPAPLIDSVFVRSTPSNLTLSLPGQPPFFVRAGEVTGDIDVPDFSVALRNFLTETQPEGGFLPIPLVVHSDLIARLQIEVEIEFDFQRNLLKPPLRTALLNFGASTLPDSQPDFEVELPAGARVLPGATQLHLQGAFQESSIALGPTGIDRPSASVSILPTTAVSQPFTLESTTTVQAIDLFLGPIGPRARLQLDLRADRGGNPAQDSLLEAAVEFDVERREAGRPFWNTVTLPTPVQLEANRPASGAGSTKPGYWLVIQNLEGEGVSWPAQTVASEVAGLRKTRNGELSWREAEVAGMTGTLKALFRLRRGADAARVAVELQIGTDEQARRVSLDPFRHQGSIDFVVDLPELADGYNQFLEEAAPKPCPTGEHLLNGDFVSFFAPNNTTDVAADQPAEWTVTSGRVAGITTGREDSDAVPAVELGAASIPTALSQVVPVAPSCNYDFSFDGAADTPDALAEVHWISSDCALIRSDAVAIQATFSPTFHFKRLASPPSASQAEVRFLVPSGQTTRLQRVSLRATADAVLNPQLRLGTDGPTGWTVEPTGGADFGPNPGHSATRVSNSGSDVVLRQTVPVDAGGTFSLETEAVVFNTISSGTSQVELRWLNSQQEFLDTPSERLTLGRNFSRAARRGRVPANAAFAELSLLVRSGTELDVGRISLFSEETLRVPLTFIAQSPGQLTVSSPKVVFEVEETPPPATPDTGLCTPTPPGLAPGGGCDELRHFCTHCQSEVETDTPQPARTPGGRPARTMFCSECGSQIVVVGGLPQAAPEIRATKRPIARNPRSLLTEALGPSTGPAPALTTLKGIGKARAGHLAEAGIDTLEKLAAASPQQVAEALRGVTAEGFIRQARTILVKFRHRSV